LKAHEAIFQVKCVNQGNNSSIYVNGIYDVFKEVGGYYLIINARGNMCEYPKELFERIKITPNVDTIGLLIEQAFQQSRNELIRILESETLDGIQKATDDFVYLHKLRQSAKR